MTQTITIEQLKQAIRGHPNSLTMEAFCQVDPTLSTQLSLDQLRALDLTNPPAGIKLCIAGWILALAGRRIAEHNIDNLFRLAHHHAEAALQVLNDSHIAHPHWELLPPLFFLSAWPIHLRQAYNAAEATNNAPAMAQAMCSAIDFFIPNPAP